MRSQYLKLSSTFFRSSSSPSLGFHSTLPTHNQGQSNRILADPPAQTAHFRPELDKHTHAEQVANVATATWLSIYIALSPIIGQQGVAAIYKKSLSLVRRDYPWLMCAQECKRTAGDFRALRTTLALQPSSTALDAHRSLVGVFYNLIRHLIGNELAERLLQHVIDHNLNG
jgi:hypothetical protein